jgi:hypothetical protein
LILFLMFMEIMLSVSKTKNHIPILKITANMQYPTKNILFV